jgi:hypothetical protein
VLVSSGSGGGHRTGRARLYLDAAEDLASAPRGRVTTPFPRSINAPLPLQSPPEEKPATAPLSRLRREPEVGERAVAVPVNHESCDPAITDVEQVCPVRLQPLHSQGHSCSRAPRRSDPGGGSPSSVRH